MADCIDREKLLEDLERFAPECRAAFLIIRKENAVDAVPVVHGLWIHGSTMNHCWMKCSECLHSYNPDGTFCYCPNCGAKMDGDVENA